MSGGPRQQPKRPKGFFEGAMLDWRQDGRIRGLTNEEMVTVSAQFLGLCIAAMDLSVEGQMQVMASASKITNTACLARTAVKQGAAWPLQPNVLAAGGVRQ